MVCYHHIQYQKKNKDQILRKLSDGRTDGQTTARRTWVISVERPIGKLQERALRKINYSRKVIFRTWSLNIKNIPFMQTLWIEIYKIINNIALPIMNSLFLFRENEHQIISNSTKPTVRHGLETVLYWSPFIWANLPQICKSQTSLHAFKGRIRK